MKARAKVAKKVVNAVAQVAEKIAEGAPARQAKRAARRTTRKAKKAANKQSYKAAKQARGMNSIGPAIQDMAGGSTLQAMAIATTLEDSKFIVRQGKAQDIIISGHEILTAVNVTTDVKEGDILYKLALTPFVASRLSNYANLYNGYKFSWWRVVYVPALSQIAPEAQGMLQLAYQPDPDAADPVATVAGDQETFAWQNTKEFGVFSSACFDGYHQKTPFYYIDIATSDRRFTVQGYIYLKAATNIAGAAAARGKLYLQYVCKLNTPHTDGYQGMASGKVNSGGTVTITNPLGTAPSLDAQALGIVVNAGTPSTISFKYPGSYQVFATYVGTTIVAANSPVITGSGSWVTDASIVNAGQNLGVICGKLQINNDSTTFTPGTLASGTLTNTFYYFTRAVTGSITARKSVQQRNFQLAVDEAVLKALANLRLNANTLPLIEGKSIAPLVNEDQFIKIKKKNKNKQCSDSE
jgi:hypothetical protein